MSGGEYKDWHEMDWREVAAKETEIEKRQRQETEALLERLERDKQNKRAAEPRAKPAPVVNPDPVPDELLDAIGYVLAKVARETGQDCRAQSLKDIDENLTPIRHSIAKLEGTIDALTKLFGMKADEIDNLKGEPGPQGERGERGLRGAPGRDGRNGMDAPVISGITFDTSENAVVLRMSDGTRGPDIPLHAIFGDIVIDRASFSIIVKTISGSELLKLPLRDLFEQYDEQRGAG